MPERTGLIAIVRGITPAEAADIGRAVYDAGWRTIEVPLNSPDPLVSIRLLREALPADCRVGAGTVLRPADVRRVADAGAEIVVSPNTDTAVIEATLAAGLASFPGAATPTEAFAAVAAGTETVKLFPGETIGAAGLKAWRAVLPGSVQLIPVGGVATGNLDVWVAAGAAGAGIGSSLFRAGDDADTVHARARELSTAWDRATNAGATGAPAEGNEQR